MKIALAQIVEEDQDQVGTGLRRRGETAEPLEIGPLGDQPLDVVGLRVQQDLRRHL